MSTGWLFGVGVLVTLIAAIGLALPVYGAVLDGRYQAERAAEEQDEPTAIRPRNRPAA